MKRGIKWLWAVAAVVVIITPMYWNGIHPVPKRTKTAEAQSTNVKVVAQDVAKTSVISLLNLQQTLNGLGNSLQLADTQARKKELLHEFAANHHQFMSVALFENNQTPLQMGKPQRPDLQQAAREAGAQNKPFVSPLYMGNDVPVAVTVSVPFATTSSTGTLVAEANMSYLKHMTEGMDRRFGTKTTLPGSDVEIMESGLQQAIQEKVQGTNWRIMVAPEKKVSPSRYEGEVLVHFPTVQTPADILKITETVKGKLVRITVNHTYILRSSGLSVADMIPLLKKMGADIAEPHVKVHVHAVTKEEPNDTFYGAYQHNLKQIYADFAWPRATGSPKVTVAVIDTGVNLQHPDLTGKLTTGINVLNNRKPPQDDNGHGTHVAGIIGARTNNSLGVAGINWSCKIMPIKAMEADGTGSVVDIADGIYWAVDHGANVINLSLGTYDSSAYLHTAIRHAYLHGVVVVAAMGNDGLSKPNYPSAYPEVIGVAALDSSNRIADFSNYGATTSLSAPGVSVASTYLGNDYVSMSGTSMAAPHVAGVAALVKSVNPALNAAQIRSILQTTSQDLGAKGKDNTYGYGKVDAYKAVQAALPKGKKR